MNARHVAAVVAVTALALTGCGSGSAPQGEPTVAAVTPAGGSSSSSTTTTTSVTPKATTSVTPKAQHPEEATASANRIKGDIASVVKVVTITEDNDPNDKIGRPGGYISAAVIYEKSVKCTDLGAGCGATIEVWASEAKAKARAAFIQKSLKDIPMLGTEYDYIRGGALLRVVGDVKPSLAKKYNAAFGGTLFE